MINNKRVHKLKKEVYRIKGNHKYNKFIIKAAEGLFLFEANRDMQRIQKDHLKTLLMGN
ncbi:MAG: hypothetical protein E6929_07740 [Clostridium sp.]|nr:hypothetical protein [Clostridium sp.]